MVKLTTGVADKKPEADKEQTIDLTSEIPLKDGDGDFECDIPPPPYEVCTVSDARRQYRRRCCVFILTCAIISVSLMALGIFLYRLHHKPTWSGWCEVRYHVPTDYDDSMDTIDSDALVGSPDTRNLAQRVEIDLQNESYEKIEIPRFDDIHSNTLVTHDFNMNLTAIKSFDAGRCFVMPLDRSSVRPPRSFYELLLGFLGNSFMPDSNYLRKSMRVELPKVSDIRQFGPVIARECNQWDTYRLIEIKEDDKEYRRKRDANKDISVLAYAGVNIVEYVIKEFP